MDGWHHRCNVHELGQTSGDDEGQGGLASCSPQSHKVGHNWATEQNKNQNVTIEANGAVQPQLQEHSQAKLEEAKKGLFPALLEEAWPWLHFDFAFLASRPVTEYLFIVLSYTVCGNLLQQPNTKDTYKTNKQKT